MDKASLTTRFRRGDTSPDRPGLVFIRYHRGKEYWSTPEALVRRKRLAAKVNAERRKEPTYQDYMRDYFREYNKRPKQKARLAEYYSRPDVLARYRAKVAADPELIAKREARAKWRAERAAYRASDEYREIKNQKSHEHYRKNQKQIHAKIAERRRKNPTMRLKQNLSRRIRQALNARRSRKSSSTVVLLGCSIPEFRAYLEALFLPGMTWSNYGKEWELDHRVPISAFVLADPQQQLLAFSFRNHQPLWKRDNRRKSDKLADGTLGRKIVRFARFT